MHCSNVSMHAFACIAPLLRYPHFQIARVWFHQMREIAKLRFSIAAQINHRLVGERMKVVATERGKNESTICRDDCYVPVVIHQRLELGSNFDVEIVDSKATHLIGKLR